MRIPTTFNKMGLSPSGGEPTWSDYKIFLPLEAYEATARTGQTITYSNVSSSNFTTFYGIPCLDCSSATRICYVEDSEAVPQGSNKARAYSGWFSITSPKYENNMRGIGIGSYVRAGEICSPNNDNMKLNGGGYYLDFHIDVPLNFYTWYHVVQQVDENNNLKLYLDGNLVYSGTMSLNIRRSLFFVGAYPDNTQNAFRGHLSTCRCWDRILTDDEVLDLSKEWSPTYEITVQDLTFSLYQKNETYGISYTSPSGTPTFEIVEGSLPNTISFNTSTGQFTGKGLTDADHTYNLKIRLTAPNSTPATCNVTIYTYKTARISLSSQSFSFISNKAESKAISYTSDESVTFTIESGTLPAGMSMSSGGYFSSNGANTSAETQQVVVRATSANNQTGVTAAMTLDMQMNAIVLNAQTFKFYTAQGVKTKTVKYSGSPNSVSDAVFSMTGTLPAGVTWDATTGSFTSDGTQSADETASVSVTVSSSNGSSTAATATMTIEVHLGEPDIPDDYVFYAKFEDSLVDEFNRSLTPVGTVTPSQIVDNLETVQLANASYIYADSSTGLPVGVTDFTASIWYKHNSNDFDSPQMFFHMGRDAEAKTIELGVWENQWHWNILKRPYEANFGSPDQSWHHFLVVHDTTSNSIKVYVDGIVGSEKVVQNDVPNITYGNLIFGSRSKSTNNCTTKGCYIKAARIYDRVLEDSEIQALASEFTPTP